MKRKILKGCVLFVLIIAVIFGLLVAWFVCDDFKQEGKLEREIQSIMHSADTENMDLEEIEEALESTIAYGDYVPVEKALKAYLSDIIDNRLKILELLNDSRLDAIMSGGDMEENLRNARQLVKELENCKEEYQKLMSEEVMLSYFSGDELYDYYLEYYEAQGNAIIGGMADDSIPASLDSVIEVLSVYDQASGAEDAAEIVYTKDFGSYSVPAGWEENEEHSTSDKFFYVQEGMADDLYPDNISINAGTNKYTADHHDDFKNAILLQLSNAVAGTEGVSINAAGSTTDQGYIVYTFEIFEEKENIRTTQYYIVGDYEYVLIHETCFSDSHGADEAARTIVNSFIWN